MEAIAVAGLWCCSGAYALLRRRVIMCNEKKSEPNLIVFDAECVFCSSFAKFVGSQVNRVVN